MNTLFFRLLKHEDKAAGLSEALEAVRQGDTPDSVVHVVDPASFQQVPGSPFAYWVSERVRRLFTELPRFEGDGRTVRVGLQTSDDFRFVRAWWEVSPARILDGGNGPAWQDELEIFQAWCRQRTFEGKRWVPFAKGGAYSPYYADLHLVVNWERDGEEIRSFDRAFIRNDGFYFRSGLTWARRSTSGFGLRILPTGAIFSDKGPVAFVDNGEERVTLGCLFSQAYQRLIEVSLAAGEETQSGTASRSYEVGLIQKLPWPDFSCALIAEMSPQVAQLAESVRRWDSREETARAFQYLTFSPLSSVREAALKWQRWYESEVVKLLRIAAIIEDTSHRILDLNSDDESISTGDARSLCKLPIRELNSSFDEIYCRNIHETIREELNEGGGNRQVAVKSFYVSRHIEILAQTLKLNPEYIARVAAERMLLPDGLLFDVAYCAVSYGLGCIFGRWDIRYTTQQRSCPELPDPFAPLPVCSPGMLVQADGLPAGPQDVPGDYPLRISWTGVLVDDEGHPDDLSSRVRQVFEVLWPERASEIEQEACDLLGVRSLRDYFARPNSFFAEHLKRYSKSRRQAPIYWPLQTPSGSYTVWLYYPRLTDQTLYTCVNDVVEPKLTQITEQLNGLSIKTNRSNQEEKELERLLDFEQELKDFRDELLRVAAFWRPNLNDGVQITAAPLWKLFQHKSWQKKLKDAWAKLAAGDYDWAHLAYSIWPDRVREKCKYDKSLAIAHGLEDLYAVPSAPAKKKPGRRRMPIG